MSDWSPRPGAQQAPHGTRQRRVWLVVAAAVGAIVMVGAGIWVALRLVGDSDDSVESEESRGALEAVGDNNAEIVGSGRPGEAGTRTEPLPMGTEVDLGNGWRVTVNSADLQADAAVATAAEFNPPPADAMRYIAVDVTAAFDGAPGREDAEAPAILWSVFGSDDAERVSFDNLATPPEPRFDMVGELEPGSGASGNLVFEVGAGEDDLVLVARTALSLDASEAWFSLDP